MHEGKCGKKGVLTSPNTTSNSYNRQGQTQVLQMQAAGGSEWRQSRCRTTAWVI